MQAFKMGVTNDYTVEPEPAADGAWFMRSEVEELIRAACADLTNANECHDCADVYDAIGRLEAALRAT